MNDRLTSFLLLNDFYVVQLRLGVLTMPYAGKLRGSSNDNQSDCIATISDVEHANSIMS